MSIQHVSFDLETLGKGPQAMIASIGAVKFDPTTGTLGDTFHRIVDLEAPGGGLIDASTVVWWMRPENEGARARLFAPDAERVPLAQALIEFSEWLGFNDDLPEGKTYPDVHLWQRGDKDAQWLTSAYEGVGFKVPFPFWAVSDQRTLCRWVPVPPSDCPERTCEAHDALGDAVHQAHWLVAVFKQLKV